MATHRFLIGWLSALYLLTMSVPIVAADSYQVNAVVPYAAPSQAADWDAGLDGKTVDSATQTMSGTCQMTSPATAVSIWRSGTAIGSAACMSNRFAVDIMLEPGDNVLLARSASASAQYGPDSSPITITLQLPEPLPPAPVPTTTSTAVPSSPAEEKFAANAGAASELSAVPTEPFSNVSASSLSVDVAVVVGGGQSPYIITLNWGDGSVETSTKQTADTYHFTHTYQQAGNYSVRGAVRDVLGAYTKFEYAVVTADKQSGYSPEIAQSGTPLSQKPFPYKTVAYTLVPVLLLGLAGLGYYFGYHRAANALKQKGKRRARR